MRRLFLILVACAPSFAVTLSTLAGCNGTLYSGTASASCQSSPQTYASASADLTTLSVDVVTASTPAGTSGALAELYGVFELTVMGGSGEAFVDPQLSANLLLNGEFTNYAEAAFTNSVGDGCKAVEGDGTIGQNTCIPTTMPVVFGKPEIVYLSLYAEAELLPGTYYPYDTASAGVDGLLFYNASGQPLNDVTYTLVAAPSSGPMPSFAPLSSVTPTPEPGLFPLLAAMACAALIARKRLRKIFPGR